MQPLQYLQTGFGLAWTIVCIPLGFLLTALGYFIINKVPASWLCDYDETPSEELLSGKRVIYRKTGIFVSIIVSVLLILTRLQFNKNFDLYFLLVAFVIFDCAMIVVADIKYQIIPDQFTIALGVTAVIVSAYDLIRGYNILHSQWWSPLAGAAIGAVLMIIVDLIGQIVYRREGVGFGDVKLFAAVGLFTGFPGTIYAFVVSILIAAVCFAGIIIVSKIMISKSGVSEIQESENTSEEEVKEEIKEKISDNSDSETEEKEETSETDDNENDDVEDSSSVGFGTYLAFGPYIVLALAIYISLFDQIQFIVRMYLNLF